MTQMICIICCDSFFVTADLQLILNVSDAPQGSPIHQEINAFIAIVILSTCPYLPQLQPSGVLS